MKMQNKTRAWLAELPEQEWLLPGRRVDQVVPCRDATAARLVVPNPRWFALHKLWFAGKPTRNPLKRDKDRKQGGALLDAVAEAMPHYALDDFFAAALPAELQPMWTEWRGEREMRSAQIVAGLVLGEDWFHTKTRR